MLLPTTSRALLLVLLAAPGTLLAQAGAPPVRYQVSLADRAHHEARITATFSGLPVRPLELRMSRSSPGRYAVHEFAKNLYDLTVRDSRGRPLTATRPNPYQWDVAGHDGTVVVEYTLFADRADGTYSGIDRTHAHLNSPATFIWARGLDRRRVTVQFPDLPANWGVATQLAIGAEPGTWQARDFQYFMDSPIELSDFDLRSWTVTSGGREQTIRLAIHHAGTAVEVDRYVADIQKVVLEQAAVYGSLATFDHGVYSFLADYLPHASGDGMEHRNSTVLTSTASLASSAAGLLGTVSHEFFHSWNVERIRPRGLEPFDFERANMAGELWLAEGFTSYYGPLAIHRAGLTTLDQYARGLTGEVNTVTNAPGRRHRSSVEMSMMAPFVDAATAIDPTSFGNTFISYYTWGAALGLALDLSIRARFPGLGLDDFMREMWRTHGITERSYTVADARAALGRTTRDTAFANDFFRRLVEGREVADYPALLARAGFLVRPARPTGAWIGDLSLSASDRGLQIGATVLEGTPAHSAGLAAGDRLLVVDGVALGALADLEDVLSRHQPGDTLPITFGSRGQIVAGAIRLGLDPRLEVLTFEAAGRPVTEAIRAFRAGWLDGKAR
jgi:predicted metalloprotease with PDZ domain